MDAETNTECMFIQQPIIGRKQSQGDILARLGASSSVKRSKTFTPSAPIAKSQYNCRVSVKYKQKGLLVLEQWNTKLLITFLVEQKRQ